MMIRIEADPFPAKKSFLIGAAILLPLALLLGPTSAQTSRKNDAARRRSHQRATRTGAHRDRLFRSLEDERLAYFREHMPENGVFWGEYGTFSRDQQLAEQQASAKACTVEGYGLSDFGALPLATGAYLLTYKADQYATCNGEKVPVHMNGSSIYIFKAGHWQAIYRAEVPLKNQS